MSRTSGKRKSETIGTSAVLRAWPSLTTANLLAVKGPSPMLSNMLRPDDPRTSRLQRFVADVVAALPPVMETTAFHAEVFHTIDDRLVLCEIACRPGGCGHAPVFERAFGANLYAASLRGQAGCTEPAQDMSVVPRCLAGFAWFPPRLGVLKRIPSTCPLPGVFSYQTKATAGQSYAGAHSIADHIASLFVLGPVWQDLEPRVRAVKDWWFDQCIWAVE